MYLLKLILLLNWRNIFEFTFHYVSIKTYGKTHNAGIIPNLHSTMYLLKLCTIHKRKTYENIYIPLCIY